MRQPKVSSLKLDGWLLGVLALFAGLALVGLLNHAMWRDEMNPWLIVRDSASLGELLQNIRYDRGHPGLWHALLWLLQGLTDTPIAMQWLHGLITLGWVSLFWLYAPFSRLEKTLFTFGYFPLYDYLLLSRNYSIGILCLFLVCVVFPSRRRTYLPLALLLGLMANCNLYSFWVSLALAVALAGERWLGGLRSGQASTRMDWGLSLLVLAVLYGVAAYTIVPPADIPPDSLGERFLQFDLHRLFEAIGRWFAGYTLIIPNANRWLDLLLCGCFAIAVALLTSLRLLKSPVALLFFNLATLEILAFVYVKHLELSERHFGHFYFVLIAALWLGDQAAAASDFNAGKLNHRCRRLAQQWHRGALLLMLMIQFAGGLHGYARDISTPLSASREVARYLRQNNLQDTLMVASRSVNATAIAGYLDRQLYYPEYQRMGSYFLPLKQGLVEMDQPDVLTQIESLLRTTPEEQVLLILSSELIVNRPTLRISEIARFENAFRESERFYLYWVNPY